MLLDNLSHVYHNTRITMQKSEEEGRQERKIAQLQRKFTETTQSSSQIPSKSPQNITKKPRHNQVHCLPMRRIVFSIMNNGQKLRSWEDKTDVKN